MPHRFPPEAEEVDRSRLPPGIVELLELLAERVDLGAGDARLEAIFQGRRAAIRLPAHGIARPQRTPARFNIGDD